MAREFKCPKCDRAFSMPAHPARHVNTIHGKKTGKKVVKKKSAKGRGVAAHRPIGDGAARLLSERQVYHAELIDQRRSLDVHIDAITRALQMMAAA